MTEKLIDHRPEAQAALVLLPLRPRANDMRAPEARLDEAMGLALALDLEVRQGEIIALRATAPSTLFGKGKVVEIAEMAIALEADVIVVDDALTPVQQRNLEKAWQVKVIDRTGLILEIFGRRARTREGKLQVELARLAYERSRLVRTWTHLERQRGGFGVMGGPGETQIETDRRLLASKIGKLKKELEEVRRTRTLQRAARKRTPFPTIALVGYTNAGKSTLFNRLTDAKVEAKDMLFATLDPTLRTMKLPDGRPAILSDTVGFISDLPHELIEAFRATLEEVESADVIVHVRDIANPDTAAQAADVMKVLAQIGVDPDGPIPIVEVWNKLDLLDEEEQGAAKARALRGELAGLGPVAVSAQTGEGVARLQQVLAGLIDQGGALEADLAPGDGRALAWLYRHGRVVDRLDDANGRVRLSVRLDPQALGQFEQMFPHNLLGHAAE